MRTADSKSTGRKALGVRFPLPTIIMTVAYRIILWAAFLCLVSAEFVSAPQLPHIRFSRPVVRPPPPRLCFCIGLCRVTMAQPSGPIDPLRKSLLDGREAEIKALLVKRVSKASRRAFRLSPKPRWRGLSDRVGREYRVATALGST